MKNHAETVKGKGAKMAKSKTDVRVLNGGTLWQFHLLTPDAKEWVAESVSIEPYMWQGDSVFACEHRCGPDLVDGMRGAGLAVAGGL